MINNNFYPLTEKLIITVHTSRVILLVLVVVVEVGDGGGFLSLSLFFFWGGLFLMYLQISAEVVVELVIE